MLEHASDSVQKGAYILSPQKGEQPAGILVATGSEVNLAVETQAKLAEEGSDVSVVSMPSLDLFEKQSVEHKESVLPKAVTKRVVIGAAASLGWGCYVETEGKTITIDHFDASAPGGLVLKRFGFIPENVANTYKSL